MRILPRRPTDPCYPRSDHRSASCASCSASVHYVGGPAEEKLALEAHRMSAGCAQDPRSSIVPTRPRCIAPGCRARPTFSMRVECGSCGGATCMAHRHVDDHACVAAAGVGRSSVSQLRQAFLSRVDGVTAPVVRGKGAGAAALTAPISSCGAESRQVTASLAKEAGVGAGAAPEQCPFCSSRFDDVSALIAHVEGGSHASRRRTVEAVQ